MVDRIDVVRIEAGTRRGTGFLVARDRLLTALHVIGTAVGDRLELHGSVALHAEVVDAEGRLRSPVHYISPSHVLAFDHELDWAFISIDPDAFAGVTVWQLGDDASFVALDEWATRARPRSG